MKKFDFLETEYHLEKKYLGFTGKGSFTYSGKIQGFYSVVKVNPDWKSYFITINAHKDEAENSLIDLLKAKEILKETNITIDDNSSSFTISYKTPFYTSQNKKKFDEIIEAVISVLKKNFYTSYVDLVQENESFSYPENIEQKKKLRTLEEVKREYDEKKENVFLGILGVIGVSLFGMLIHIGVVFANYNSWITYVLLVPMSCHIYKKLAGKISKKSLIYIFIVLIISLLIANYLAFILYYYFFENYEGITLYEVFQEISPYIIYSSEIRNIFLIEIFINIGILLLVLIISFINIVKEEMEYLKFKKNRKE